MLRLSCRLLVPLFVFSLLAVANVQGEVEQGWTAIFDGTDMNGWRYDKGVLQRQMETPDQRFVVKDGVLLLNPKDRDGKKEKKSLETIREFSKDFDLKLEFKAANEAHASLTVRKAAVPIGDFKRRSEFPGLTKFKTDDWNELHIRVRTHGVLNGTALKEDDKVEVTYNSGKPTATLNGKPVTALPLRLSIVVTATVECNGQRLVSHEVPVKGAFSINTDFGKIEFRNIRFKEVQ
jgi:hypothetical protein